LYAELLLKKIAIYGVNQIQEEIQDGRQTRMFHNSVNFHLKHLEKKKKENRNFGFENINNS
jgi:hypothetical protein